MREGDARTLADLFEPGEFDYAHAGFVLHQLPDIEVMTVLRAMDRLTRRGLIWNDLARSPITTMGLRAVLPVMPRLVRHDAPVSARAAFTKREALELARRVGLDTITYRRHLFYRFTLTSTKGGYSQGNRRVFGSGSGPMALS